jgi:hypothetical protein
MRKLAILATMAAVVAVGTLAFGLALPVAADPASTATVTDFETQALDAAGQFKQVECSSAHQTVKGDKVTETYTCEFLPGSWLGAPALPAKAMHWDYESSTGLVDGFLSISGPYRWFSDIEHILTPDDCFWFSNDWRMVITPSGKVNVTVVYDPVDFGAGC